MSKWLRLQDAEHFEIAFERLQDALQKSKWIPPLPLDLCHACRTITPHETREADDKNAIPSMACLICHAPYDPIAVDQCIEKDPDLGRQKQESRLASEQMDWYKGRLDASRDKAWIRISKLAEDIETLNLQVVRAWRGQENHIADERKIALALQQQIIQKESEITRFRNFIGRLDYLRLAVLQLEKTFTQTRLAASA